MATYGLWFWLLVNLSDEQSNQRIFKRDTSSAGECPNHKSQHRNSFLWAMDRNPPVYFFGTIHVPYTKVWDHIPANSERAFYSSQNIYFELDLTDPVTLRTLAKCQILPEGVKLRHVIPRRLFKRIRSHLSYIRQIFPKWMTLEQRMMGLKAKDLYSSLTNDWRRKRPIWVMLMLNALNEYDTKTRGISVLDTFLIREAVSWNKKKGSIESVEEQCGPLNALNNSQVIVALNHTLVMHEKIRRGEAELTYSTKELVYHYNCGDLNKILSAQDVANGVYGQNSSLSSTEMEQTRKLDQYLKDELIYKRNRRMAKRVLKLIEEEPKKTFFFAFGAGHFLGNGSVIKVLQEQGHNISHLKPNDPLPRYGNLRAAKARKKIRWTRKRNKKRKHKRRKQKKKQKKMNVDNLWQRIDGWTPLTFTATTSERATKEPTVTQSSTTKANTDTTYSSATGLVNMTWSLWLFVTLFLLWL